MNKKQINIQVSSNTFMVDRMVFTEYYPEMKGDILRVYLLMCRVVGFKNTTFFMGKDEIKKEVNLTTHYVNQAIDFLEKNYFIKKVGHVGRANKYKVLNVPLYNMLTNTYFSRESMPRTRYDLKDSLNGYAELPVEVFKGSILRDRTLWTDRKIKTLTMLYSYHFIDVFGGIDPSAIHGTVNTLFVDDFVVYQIGCHKNDLKKTIQILIRDGYAIKVPAVYRVNANSCLSEKQYVGDLTEVTQHPGDDVVTVIRMTHIPDLKLNNALKRTQGAIRI